MPISKDYLLKKVGNEYMIIPLSDGNVNMSKVYTVNEVAADIHELLKENSIEETIEKMVDMYDATKDVIASDVYEFVEKLKKRGIYCD